MPHKGTYDKPDYSDVDIQKVSPEFDKNVKAPSTEFLGTGLARKAGEAVKKSNEEKKRVLDELLKD